MRPVLSIALCTSALLLALPSSAFTFHRVKSGATARWQAEAIDVTVDPSVEATGPDATDAVKAAFSAWTSVPGAHLPKITLHTGAADDAGYRRGAENHSTVRFAPEGATLAGDALGITVLSYDDAGQILDADVIINGGGDRTFAVLHDGEGDDDHAARIVPPAIRYDLQNVLTHEVGHFFGLGEEPDLPDATMFPTSGRGETKKRDLFGDDEDGITSLYPAADSAPGPSFSCSASGAPGSELPSGAAGLVALALAALAVRSARRT